MHHTNKSERDIILMVDVLLLVSMVDRYYIDFMNDCKDAGMYKQQGKRLLNECERLAIIEQGRAYRVFSDTGNGSEVIFFEGL